MATRTFSKESIQYIDNQTAITSLANLPNGTVSIRVNQLSANTIGVPTELATDFQTMPWQIQGGWQNNGFYKGIMFCGYPTSAPAVAPRVLLLFFSGMDFYFVSIDGANVWKKTET